MLLTPHQRHFWDNGQLSLGFYFYVASHPTFAPTFLAPQNVPEIIAVFPAPHEQVCTMLQVPRVSRKFSFRGDASNLHCLPIDFTFVWSMRILFWPNGGRPRSSDNAIYVCSNFKNMAHFLIGIFAHSWFTIFASSLLLSRNPLATYCSPFAPKKARMTFKSGDSAGTRVGSWFIPGCPFHLQVPINYPPILPLQSTATPALFVFHTRQPFCVAAVWWMALGWANPPLTLCFPR